MPVAVLTLAFPTYIYLIERGDTDTQGKDTTQRCTTTFTEVFMLLLAIDDKNINLQIKNIKKCLFTFIKTSKNMDKNIKLQYPFK